MVAGNIRLASSHDIEKLIQVRFDYFAAEEWEVSVEQYQTIKTSLRQYYTKYINIDFFAAFVEENTEIASVAFLAITHKPANLGFPTGKIGTILNVLTYPEYRKKGYAISTMNALISEAKKQNCSYVELSASESGKSIYKKLGFVEIVGSERFTEMKLSLL